MPYDAYGTWHEGQPVVAQGFQYPYGSISDQSAAIATGMGETDPRARSVYDFAPIYDSALNRANSTGYVPQSYLNQMGGTDPLHAVFTSPRYGNTGYQYDAWGNAHGGPKTNAMYEAYQGLGNPTSTGMTNAEIAYYGTYGPYGDLRGNSMGATSYLNPSVVQNPSHAQGFVDQAGGPRDLSVFNTGSGNPYLRQMFNPQTSYNAFDTDAGVINATTGYYRDVYQGGIPEPTPYTTGGSNYGETWNSINNMLPTFNGGQGFEAGQQVASLPEAYGAGSGFSGFNQQGVPIDAMGNPMPEAFGKYANVRGTPTAVQGTGTYQPPTQRDQFGQPMGGSGATLYSPTAELGGGMTAADAAAAQRAYEGGQGAYANAQLQFSYDAPSNNPQVQQTVFQPQTVTGYTFQPQNAVVNYGHNMNYDYLNPQNNAGPIYV